jgi:hypothetical protein
MLLEQLADYDAGGVIGIGYAQQYLDGCRVVLCHPTGEAAYHIGFQPFKWFKDGYGWREGFVRATPVKGEVESCKPLPKNE